MKGGMGSIRFGELDAVCCMAQQKEKKKRKEKIN